eukprot:399686-Prymnesium_polylepis.1
MFQDAALILRRAFNSRWAQSKLEIRALRGAVPCITHITISIPVGKAVFRNYNPPVRGRDICDTR